VIHLYALVGPQGVVPAVRGLDDADLEVLECGALRAVVSHHDQPPARDQEHVLAHAAVTEAVARATPTLPVRFDAPHRDASALRGEIEQRSTELAALLDRVGGCVEFVIRARPRSPATPGQSDAQGGPGQQYLQQRLAEEQAKHAAVTAARERLDAVVTGLETLARQTRPRVTGRGPEMAYLVEQEQAERFRAAAQQRAAADPDTVLGGPWPPYTFAGGSAPDG
jgi:hypothetical protein